MVGRFTRYTPQPLTGVVSAGIGLAILASCWVVAGSPLTSLRDPFQLLLACFLVLSVVAAYMFPIDLDHETQICMGSVALFLIIALLPGPLAPFALTLGKLAGELAVRKRNRTYPADIASQVGRWMVIAVPAAWLAHLPVSGRTATVLLPLTAFVLWAGDIITAPVLLSPATGEPPLKVIDRVVREAGELEGAQYLVGILGALAALQAIWSVFLLILPTALVYLSFKSAKDTRERTRRLLHSVVESAPDAIMLLDVDGTVVTTNRQAATVYGYADPERMVGLKVLDSTADEDQARLRLEIERTLTGGRPDVTDYTLLRKDGTSFVGELSWALVVDKRGRPEGLTAIVRDVTDRKRAQQALEHRALHDPLTDLPNRLVFQDRLHELMARARRDGLSFSVCLIDLDRFKQVNDTFGHSYGDALLKQVAGRFRRTLRETDTVARLGGDEFALLLPKADRHGAGLVATRVLESLTAPFEVEQETLSIGASIGIAVYPIHGDEVDLLVDEADTAMYTAKSCGGGYTFYGSPHVQSGPVSDDEARAGVNPAAG